MDHKRIGTVMEWDIVLNGEVFLFLKDSENALFVKEVIEVMHFCMIRHQTPCFKAL